MKEDLLKNARSAEEKIAKAVREASRFKDVVSDAAEDALVDARRTARRSYRAAEDLIEEATYQLKRNPWRSAAIVFGAGALFGLLLSRGLIRKP